MITATWLSEPLAASFWEVQRFFLARTLDFEAMKDALVIIISILAVIASLSLYFHIRNRNRPYIPQDWITDPKAIRALIQNALDQRVKFELQFASPDGTRRPALRCSGIELLQSGLLLEATGLTALSDRWVDRTLDCFFLLVHKEQNTFHAFTTSVDKIQVTGTVCFIRLRLPVRIESRQKRSYLRIVPPDEYLLSSAIWRGPDMPEETVRDTLAGWTKPSLVLLPATRTDFTIKDISSGGMRVHLPRRALPAEMPHINASNQMMLMLDLWDPDKMQRLRFWLLCRVQNPVLDFETKGMDLGLQFLAWAKPQETESGGSLVWLRLASSGEVEPLGNWIMRRHLEFFRETEQSASAQQKDGGLLSLHSSGEMGIKTEKRHDGKLEL